MIWCLEFRRVLFRSPNSEATLSAAIMAGPSPTFHAAIGEGRAIMAADNVASLFGSAPPVPTVDAEVVEALEELLRLACDGLPAGFAYATGEVNGNIGPCWEGTGDRHGQIAAV